MALIDSIILASCVGLSGQSNDACTKALTAGAKQTGVESKVGTYETHQVKKLETTANSWLGKDTVSVVGGTAWAVKAAAEKKASFGLYGPLHMEVGSKLTQMVLKWTF